MAAATKQTPAQEIGKLKRLLAMERERLGRLHEGVKLVAELIRREGSLNAAGRAVAWWSGQSEETAQRAVRAVWNCAQPPSREAITRFAAAVDQQEAGDRQRRIREHVRRVEVDLAAIDAAEAGTEAPRLDEIG